jgi:glutaconate CoA-transferase subunit B
MSEPTAGSGAPVPAPGFTKSEMMIVAAARELAGQHVCFVGVGLPNIAVNLARVTVAPELELVYESGVFGAKPARLRHPFARLSPVTLELSPWEGGG